MAYQSALDIIKQHLPPEEAIKFHKGSRKPFPEEQSVIDIAHQAAQTIMKKSGSKTLFNWPK